MAPDDADDDDSDTNVDFDVDDIDDNEVDVTDNTAQDTDPRWDALKDLI